MFFLAEFKYWYWAGRRHENHSFYRLIKADNKKRALEKAEKYLEKHLSEKELFIVDPSIFDSKVEILDTIK